MPSRTGRSERGSASQGRFDSCNASVFVMAGLERFTLRPAERRLHASDHVPTVDFDTLKRASADCSDAAAHQRT